MAYRSDAVPSTSDAVASTSYALPSASVGNASYSPARGIPATVSDDPLPPSRKRTVVEVDDPLPAGCSRKRQQRQSDSDEAFEAITKYMIAKEKAAVPES